VPVKRPELGIEKRPVNGRAWTPRWIQGGFREVCSRRFRCFCVSGLLMQPSSRLLACMEIADRVQTASARSRRLDISLVFPTLSSDRCAIPKRHLADFHQIPSGRRTRAAPVLDGRAACAPARSPLKFRHRNPRWRLCRRGVHLDPNGGWNSELVHRIPGETYHVDAAHIHRIVELPQGECWTLVRAGPTRGKPGSGGSGTRFSPGMA
jgi:hypothetical protein